MPPRWLDALTKFNKTKNRNRLANENLKAILRVATNNGETNITKIVK